MEISDMQNRSIIFPKICIAGKIASGKSILSQTLSASLGIAVVSLGKILRDYHIAHNLPADRAYIQDFGKRLIEQFGGRGKFLWMINHSPDINWHQPLIIDGFRSEDAYLQCKG